MQLVQNLIKEMYDSRKVYDYSEENKIQLISLIKEKFKNKCQQDKKLTEEYKNFVKNLDNINVRINYGYQIKVIYRDITLRSSFEYYDTYEKGKYIRDGKGTIDYQGNIHIDSADIRTDYGREKYSKTVTNTLYSTTRKQYIAYLGADKLKNAGMSQRKTDFEIVSPELQKALNRRISPKSFDEMVQNNIPPEIENELLESNYKQYDLKKRTFKIVGVEDYNVEKADLTIMPTSVDVFVYYKGKKYEKNEVGDINAISSVGEFHERYNVFADEVEKYKWKDEGIGHKILLGFEWVVAALPAIIFVLLFFNCHVLSSMTAEDGLMGLILRIIGSVVSCGICMLICGATASLDPFSLSYDDFANELNKCGERQIILFVRKKYKKAKLKEFFGVLGTIAVSAVATYFIWISALIVHW